MKFSKLAAIPLLAVLMVASVSVALAQDNSQTGHMSDTRDTKVSASPALDAQIGAQGNVVVHGAKVTAISGSTITATQTWGSYSMSWTVTTNGSTKFLRRLGAAAAMSEFSVGDRISFSGSLDQSQAQATVLAKVVRDLSIQKESASLSGTVASVNSAATSFVLDTKSNGNVIVLVSAGTDLMKGSATTTFAAVEVNQNVKVSGIWDTAAHTLQAQTVKISVDQSLLNKRIFEGVLGTLSGTSLPSTFTYTVGDKSYTVNVAANTSLLSNGWNPILMNQLHAGDKVRIYGAVEPTNMSMIDAYIIRDVSVK